MSIGKNSKESEHVITTRLLREVCLEMMRSIVSCDQEIIPLLRCPCLRDGPWPPPQPDRGSEVARLMNLGPSDVKYSAAKLPVIRAPVLSWSQPPPVLRGAFYWGSVFNTYHKVVHSS